MNVLRHVAGAAGVAVIMALAFYVQHLRDRAGLYAVTLNQLHDERATFEAWRLQQEKNDAAASAFHAELAGLRRDVRNAPAPVVRVCPPVPAPSAPYLVPAAGGIDTGAPSPGSVSPGAGLPAGEGADIGPHLARMFDRCDEMSAQLRAILMRENDDGR